MESRDLSLDAAPESGQHVPARSLVDLEVLQQVGADGAGFRCGPESLARYRKVDGVSFIVLPVVRAVGKLAQLGAD